MSEELRKVRIGVVGVGYIGQVHVDAYVRHPLCDVIAICDVDPERLHDTQRRFHIERAYADQRLMHEREQLDGVVIATPDEHHLQPVQVAADAGVAIMLEKPIATTVADAEAIIDATDRARVTLMLGFILRWVPQYVAVHDRAASGALGTLTNAYARRSCRYSEARRLRGRCSVNQYLAVHDIDTLLWNLGRDVAVVYSTAGDFALSRELQTPDYYWNVIKFANGATGVVHASWAEPDAYRNYVESELLINGERGSAHLLLANQQLAFASDTTYETPSVTPAFPLEAAHFVDCIRFHRRPLAGGQEGLDALRILEACEASVRSGGPVRVRL